MLRTKLPRARKRETEVHVWLVFASRTTSADEGALESNLHRRYKWARHWAKATKMRERENIGIRSRTGPAVFVGSDSAVSELTFPRDVRHHDADLPVSVPGSHTATVEVTRPSTAYERFGKPVFDFVVAAMLLVLTAPVFLVLAIAVRLSMGRGVIFRQKRIGKRGRTFTVYKFRTMRPDRRQQTVGSAPSTLGRRRTPLEPQEAGSPTRDAGRRSAPETEHR